METFNILPWIGPSCRRDAISVLLLSQNNTYLENLRKHLNDTHLEKHNQWSLSIHCSNDVESILMHFEKLGAISIDFVVLCADIGTFSCTDWAARTLERCGLELSGRTLLVAGSEHPPCQTVVTMSSLVALRHKHNLPLLNGDLSSPCKCEQVARRVHIVLTRTLGLQRGLPCVPAARMLYPTHADFNSTTLM